MASKVATTCLLLGFALLCGLQNIEGHPSVDPPMPGMRRAAESMSAESDEMLDDTQGPPAAPVSPAGPSLNPLLPLIARMKPGKLVDPTQFIQMKAELLKNLLGPGGPKSPLAARYVARAVTSKGSGSGSSKWAGAGAAWASGMPAAPGKWGMASAKTSKDGKPAAPAQPAQPSPWDWPPAAPAAQAAPAPQAPAAPMAPAPMAPAAPAPGFNPSVPGYWIPSSILPVPADPTDKKAALVEALLDNLLSPPMQPMPAMNAPMRLARLATRTPVADPAMSGPSAGLSEILDSLNLTVPAALPTLKPTIEPPGFWFPSYVPAAPGSLTPFVVDPTAQIAKKTKFLSDLFASKAAAAAALAAAGPAASPSASLTARAVDPSEYTAKVSSYIDSLIDSTSNVKRASGMAPTKKQMKAMKGSKASKVAAAPAPAPAAAAPAPAMPQLLEEAAEDESEGPLYQSMGLYGLRKKREIDDETEADMADPADVAVKAAAIAADMAAVKQNILVQLDAMSKTEMAASKSIKLATKATKKAGLAALLGIPIPTPVPVPASAVTDYQPKIAVLTNIYSQLSDSLKNLTSAPDAMDPLNPDKLFVAAVNARITKIMMRNALLPVAAAPKVARSSNSWQRWRGQQDSDAASQYEGDNETNRRQKSAVPLVAAVFAPQTTHYMSRQPNNW